MPRRFQFSMRALLVAMAIAAVASLAIRHWRENRLEVLVDRYNDLFLAHNYAEAEKVASNASDLYPDELVTRQMVYICKMLRRAEAHPVEQRGYYPFPQREGER